MNTIRRYRHRHLYLFNNRSFPPHRGQGRILLGYTMLVDILVLGIAGIIGTVLISDILISSLLGVFSFSSFWTIKEIFEQRERVLKGWFPMNPKRKHEYE